jgi:cyclopropane fatty-acyl-phospholipid synthase-like methyltransferase
VNGVHNAVCASARWARRAEFQLIPVGLDGIDLGDDVLEIGPGFGATMRVLAQRLGKLSVLELDASATLPTVSAVRDAWR